MDFHYVYILTSTGLQERFYTGITRNLKERLLKYNRGEVPRPARYRSLTNAIASVSWGNA